MNGATPYDALVPIAVNLLVSLAKPLFNGVKNAQAHDNAVRAFTFLLAGLLTSAIAVATGDTTAAGALQAALSALYGGSTAMAIFHAGQKSGAPAPLVALAPQVSFGPSAAPAIIDYYQPAPPARPVPPVAPARPVPPPIIPTPAPVPWPNDPSEGGPHARPERGPTATP